MKRKLVVVQIVALSCAVFLVFGVWHANASSSKVLVEKRYWSDDPSQTTQKNTFTPGETVIVSISISSLDEAMSGVNLIDRLPRNIVPITGSDNLKDESRCHVSKAEDDNFVISDTDSSEIKWNNISISQTPKYYCYKFAIDTDAEAKNYIEQTEVKVEMSDNGVVVGNENDYLMIVGSIWANSSSAPSVVETPGVDGKIPSIDTAIQDKLVKEDVSIKTKDGIGQDKAPSYLYQTSSGKSTRGGFLSSYPVKVTDKSGGILLGEDPSYLFYNPLYYVFGNIFSGDSTVTRAFDFDSKNSTIAKKDGDTSKLNSEATLYNYDFDENSLIYWDRANADKNKQMFENISKYISDPKPEIVCDMKALGLSKSSFTRPFYSRNGSCNPGGITFSSTLYPKGRVWYYEADPLVDGNQIDLDTFFFGTGTVIIDFAKYDSGETPVVNIKKIGASYSDYAGSLGLMVINGGNVVLSDELSRYSGIIFVPGSQSGSGGKVEFSQDGKSLTINGSIVADRINFNTRQKNAKGYGATIYYNSKVLSALPGFESVSSVLLK